MALQENGFGESAPRPLKEVEAEREDPLLSLTLWPNRSMSKNGFTWVMVFTAAMLTFPIIPIFGTQAAFALLPFLFGTLILLWCFIRKNYSDGHLQEDLRLWPDLISVERTEPNGTVRRWSANPFWVKPNLHKNAQIESYLTLSGNGREIELGAFLSPFEREELFQQIKDGLAKSRRTGSTDT
jgi:uncharacterized membrane protein